MGDGNLDELQRRPVVGEVAIYVGREDARILFVVEEPARHVEELANRDLITVRDEPGQPLLDGVVEAKLAFGDQLQDDRCDVGLRVAGDPEAVANSHRRLLVDVAEAAGDADGAVLVANHQDGAGNPGGDECVEVFLKLRRACAFGVRRVGDGGGG